MTIISPLIPIKPPLSGRAACVGHWPCTFSWCESSFLSRASLENGDRWFLKTKGWEIGHQMNHDEANELRDEKFWIKWTPWILNSQHKHLRKLCFVRKRTGLNETFGLGIGRGCRFRRVEEPFGFVITASRMEREPNWSTRHLKNRFFSQYLKVFRK